MLPEARFVLKIVACVGLASFPAIDCLLFRLLGYGCGPLAIGKRGGLFMFYPGAGIPLLLVFEARADDCFMGYKPFLFCLSPDYARTDELVFLFFSK